MREHRPVPPFSLSTHHRHGPGENGRPGRHLGARSGRSARSYAPPVSYVALWYLAASAAAFVAFWLDKRLAQGGGRRIRERTLHLGSALGGWPGALVAMHLLRHKNRKAGFVAAQALIAFLHVASWVSLWLLST